MKKRHVIASVAKQSRNWIAASAFGLLAMTALLLLTACPAHAGSGDTTTGLIGHWKLDESGGTTAADSAGSATGTMGGGLSADNDSVGGVQGSALHLDGTDDYIDTTYVTNQTRYTISAWVKADSDPVFGTATKIIDRNSNYSMNWNHTSNPTSCEHHDGGWKMVKVTGLKADKWYHMVCTYDGTNIRIYVNGVEGGAIAATDPGSAGSVLAIGRLSGSTRYFDGIIDDVRLYNRALTADDVNALYVRSNKFCENPVGTPGELRYNADRAALQYCDGDSWVMTGLGSYNPVGIKFNSSSDYLSAGLTGTQDSGKWSGSFWFQRYSQSGADTRTLLDTDTNDLSIDFFPSDELVIDGQNASGTRIMRIRSSAITDTKWHHVLFSVDMTDTNKRHIYVDGVSDLAAVNDYTNGQIDFTNPTLAIGAGTSSSNKFDGALADVWLDFGTYIDLSDPAMRAKFVSPTGTPMYLGEDGSLPTGFAPDIFLSGDVDTWHTNKGTGGGFTENGTLTEALVSIKKTGSVDPELLNCSKTTGSTSFSSQGQYATGAVYMGLWVEEPYIFVTNGWTDGTTPLDVLQYDASGTSLTLVDQSVEGMNFPEGIWKDGEYIFVGTPGSLSDPEAGLHVFRWDGSNLTFVTSEYTVVSQVRQIWGDGTYIYAPAGDQGVMAFTFDGATLTKVGNTLADNASRFSHAAYADDGYIYLAQAGAGLEVHTFDGTNWTLVDSDATPGSTVRIYSDGQYIYTANNSGASAYSFDGSALTLIDTYAAGDNGRNIWGDGQHIYLAADGAGVLALTFDGTNFTLADTYPVNFSALSVAGDGNNIFIGDENNAITSLGGFACGWCSSPEGAPGTLVYNADHKVMQYCNGYEWVAMSKIGGTGGAGCASPAGVAGELRYTSADEALQYCNTEDWVTLGKPVAPTSGLVGHWRLDETSGAIISDSAGSNNGAWIDGDNTDVSEETSAGVVGGSLVFDGVDDKAAAGDVASYDSGSFTTSFWVYKTAVLGTNENFVTKRHSISPYRSWRVYLSSPSGRIYFAIKDTTNTDYYLWDPDTAVWPAWHHIVAVYDSAGSTAFLYVDGVLKDAKSVPSLYDSDGELRMANESGDQFLSGKLDDIRIYNRALTAGEVQQLYEATR